MTPSLIVGALNRCAEMLTPRSVAIAHAGIFSSYVQKNGKTPLYHPVKFAEDIGLPDNVVRRCAPLSLKGPTNAQVLSHVAQMSVELFELRELSKRSRWAGFAAGAAAAAGRTTAYLGAGQGSSMNLPLALTLANLPNSSNH